MLQNVESDVGRCCVTWPFSVPKSISLIVKATSMCRHVKKSGKIDNINTQTEIVISAKRCFKIVSVSLSFRNEIVYIATPITELLDNQATISQVYTTTQ